MGTKLTGKLGIFVIGFVVGILALLGSSFLNPTPAPDITVMPCSAWTNTQNPVIPANTFTGACLAEDGSFIPASTHR